MPERKVFLPLLKLPLQLSPKQRGQNPPPKKRRFRISTVAVQAGNGFLYSLAARLILMLSRRVSLPCLKGGGPRSGGGILLKDSRRAGFPEGKGDFSPKAKKTDEGLTFNYQLKKHPFRVLFVISVPGRNREVRYNLRSRGHELFRA